MLQTDASRPHFGGDEIAITSFVSQAPTKAQILIDEMPAQTVNPEALCKAKLGHWPLLDWPIPDPGIVKNAKSIEKESADAILAMQAGPSAPICLELQERGAEARTCASLQQGRMESKLEVLRTDPLLTSRRIHCGGTTGLDLPISARWRPAGVERGRR
jgi:hypothetical protein